MSAVGVNDNEESTVVIVGASHAAAQAIATLRSKGWAGRIVLVGDEPTLPYQRPPLSKKYFNDDMIAEQLAIKAPAFYEVSDVEVKLNTRVEFIDRKRKTLGLNTGETLAYSHLILATGTRPRELPVPGADLPGIFYLRTQGDVERIKAQVGEGGRLLIVGAGYIGLEVAASAVKRGIKLTVIEAMDRVLARVTSPVVSAFYQSLHAEEGVDIRLSCGLEKFEATDRGLRARLSDGSTLDADCAIIGIGVLPNVELAEAAGLNCDNGIVVDEFCCTDDAEIFAVGDCCNHPCPAYGRRVRLESVPNAVEQAKTAAMSICGKHVPYDQVPWFWSDQYDVKLQTVGLCQGYDEVVVREFEQPRKLAVFYLQQGQLIAVDALNAPAEFMISKKLVANKARPDPGLLADAEFSLKTLLL